MVGYTQHQGMVRVEAHKVVVGTLQLPLRTIGIHVMLGLFEGPGAHTEGEAGVAELAKDIHAQYTCIWEGEGCSGSWSRSRLPAHAAHTPLSLAAAFGTPGHRLKIGSKL